MVEAFHTNLLNRKSLNHKHKDKHNSVETAQSQGQMQAQNGNGSQVQSRDSQRSGKSEKETAIKPVIILNFIKLTFYLLHYSLF